MIGAVLILTHLGIVLVAKLALLLVITVAAAAALWQLLLMGWEL
jgi:hypothetical protein